MERFLAHSHYVDYHHPSIQAAAEALFFPDMTDADKARRAYHFVRDDIHHSFDYHRDEVPVTASEVLACRSGICHAKANLLAALLRREGIPTGFCFERITYASEGEGMGYCTHALSAVYLNGKWARLDARGNREGVNAQFSLEEPILAYPPRPQYEEFLYPGIYAAPHPATMEKLERSRHPKELYYSFPDELMEAPDLLD